MGLHPPVRIDLDDLKRAKTEALERLARSLSLEPAVFKARALSRRDYKMSLIYAIIRAEKFLERQPKKNPG